MQEWQQTAEFPDGDFALATLVPLGGGHFLAHGQLTLHGSVRELDFPMSITTDRKIYAIDGAVSLDTSDYGLPVIRKLGVLRVNPKVTVKFHVQGSLDVAESWFEARLPGP